MAIYTCIGISFIFLMTSLGSAFVFLLKEEISPRANSAILGFASGIMIAASVWSLLIPAIDLTVELDNVTLFSVISGFLSGGAFLYLLDKTIPHLHVLKNVEEGVKSALSKDAKMLLAVTIHNIPEGLAVGFAFGGARLGGELSAYLSALSLAIGIGVQNVPEGLAVSLPLSSALKSKPKAFLSGVLSGAVEPLFGVAGYFLSAYLIAFQPFLLSFAAGAMLFVVSEDLIPEACFSDHFGTFGVILGFALMMALDTL